MISADLSNYVVDVQIAERSKMAKNKKFLTGRFPVLELTNGDTVFEGEAVCLHFARNAQNSGVLGNTQFQAAQIDQWISFAQLDIQPLTAPILKAKYSGKSVKAENLEKLKSKVVVLDL